MKIFCCKIVFTVITDNNHLKYLVLAQRTPISTPISTNIFQKFNEDFLSDTHETEYLEEVIEQKEPEHDDDDDVEILSTLINAIRQRHPLWDHRLPLSAGFEPKKKSLWNEIYVELNGMII